MTDDSSQEPVVAPLDAYATAKPDEPTFTLQGGDPLAEPIVKLWAHCARVRTGTISGDAEWVQPVLEAACHPDNDLSDLPREVENLLRRATAAEEVAWSMREYCSDHTSAGIERPTSAGENFLAEKDRLDLYDKRVHAVNRISEAESHLLSIEEDLLPLWPDAPEGLAHVISEARELLKSIRNEIEYRRLFKSG